MILGSKIIRKNLRKKLFMYEDKFGFLTALINLGVKENLKQFLYEHLLVKKDKKKKIDISTRFLLKTKSIIERKIITNLSSNKFKSSNVFKILNLNSPESIDKNKSIEKIEELGVIDFDQDEVIFHNQNDKSKGNMRYNE